MYTVLQTQEFVAWLDELKDKRVQVRIVARLRQAESGNLGDWQSVAGEVSEMRVHFGPSTAAQRFRNKMKAMDSAWWQGANRSNTEWYCEDLQRRHRVEDALSCFEISGSQY